jgi:hypothetical protein
MDLPQAQMIADALNEDSCDPTWDPIALPEHTGGNFWRVDVTCHDGRVVVITSEEVAEFRSRKELDEDPASAIKYISLTKDMQIHPDEWRK